MAIDNVTAIPLAPTNRSRKVKPMPSIDDMEKASNGLHLAKDWTMYQGHRENTVDQKSICAVMALLYDASAVLEDCMAQEERHG